MRTCEECGADISHKRWSARFCSEKHRRRAEARRHQKTEGYKVGKRVRDKRYREQPHDKARKAANGKAWRAANPDKVAASNECAKAKAKVKAQTVAAQRKHIRELKKAATVVGRAFVRLRRQQWREYKATDPVYLAEQKEKKRQYQRKWYLENKDKSRENDRRNRRTKRHRRRAAERGCRQGRVPHIEELLKRQGGRCASCKRMESRILKGPQGVKWNIDHVIPVSDLGANAIENIEVLCYWCNHAKSNKSPEEWELENGRLPFNLGAR